jgi:FtsP/CotA-like multicopper oxidase with cupredoxin domain
MKRRHFLQLAAGAAAGAMVEHSSAWSSIPGFSLRVAPLCIETTAGTLVDTTMIALDGDPVSTPAAIAALSLAVGEPIGTYARFRASAVSAPEPDQVIEMLLEKKLDTHQDENIWIVNGRPFVDNDPLYLMPGRRYRLRLMNGTPAAHPVHLHGHRFELTRINQVPVAGIFKDTIRLDRYNVVEADIVVPGAAINWLGLVPQAL